jgi:hypothetical protein
MKVIAKLPVIIEFPTDHNSSKPTAKDDYMVSDFITNFKTVTGIRLKAKCLEPHTSSSYTSWILYVNKDKNYTAALKKFVANND